MKCNNCGSENIKLETVSYVKSQSRSILWNLLMIILTGGLWLLWMILRKKKEVVIVETWATCQDCGKRWKIEKGE